MSTHRGTVAACAHAQSRQPSILPLNSRRKILPHPTHGHDNAADYLLLGIRQRFAQQHITRITTKATPKQLRRQLAQLLFAIGQLGAAQLAGGERGLELCQTRLIERENVPELVGLLLGRIYKAPTIDLAAESVKLAVFMGGTSRQRARTVLDATTR